MRQRDENKEQAICEKAIEMIVKHGFDGLSMQKLAKAAGVSPATIYIYFKDREDLILQLCVRESQKMIESTFIDFSPEMSFEEGMHQQWKNRATYWIAHPLEAQFLEQAKHTPYGEKAFQNIKREFSSTMGKFLSKAVEEGELIDLPKELFWSIAFAPLYTLIKFHLAGKGMSDVPFVLEDKAMYRALQLVLKALKPIKSSK
jgi:AcrR family transcriptional regulator